jgi:aspartyl-tRNA(Asn)/glutamyl-tRNA(Gln) amidotransferase subunit B
MRSADEAYAYVNELKQRLQFVEVSTCDMEKGHLRCDANVSVRLRGAEKFGTKAEIKNLNSFRFLKQAVDFEIARQVAVVESGGRVVQETRLYDSDRVETFSMRSKEDAHDYRYFPEPDLVPLRIGAEWLSRIRSEVPELPGSRRARFTGEYGLRDYDAEVLTATRDSAEYFESVAKASGDPKTAANWVMGDLMGLLKAQGKDIAESPVSAAHLGELVRMIAKGEVSGKLAKEIFAKMFATGDAPATIMEREGLQQISDTGELERVIEEVIANNPKQVEQFRGGKTTVINFLVGQAMRATRGQANVAVITQLFKRKLGSGEAC